jgi:hypothetical protein
MTQATAPRQRAVAFAVPGVLCLLERPSLGGGEARARSSVVIQGREPEAVERGNHDRSDTDRHRD